MDSQDHKTTGMDGHDEVYNCLRCGWPYPKQHPSSKHRRQHKRVCGTIEGYKIILSEEKHDHHLGESDDSHPSDEDEHTPSPKPVKKTAEEINGSGGVGEKSNKSEDDVFSDAKTEFKDTGISPKLERFVSALSGDEIKEPEVVEGDLNDSKSVKVDESTDKTKESNDDPTRSEEKSNPEDVVNANQPENAISITDTSAEAVPVELINGSQPDLIKSDTPGDVAVDNANGYDDGEILQAQMKAEHDADIQREEDNLTSVTSNPEEAKISESEVEIKEEESEEVKHDLIPQTETPQHLDGSSVELNSSTEIVNAEKANEIVDMQPSDASEHSDVVPKVSSVDKEVDPQTSLGGEEEKCIATREFKNDVDHSEEKSTCKLLETNKNEGASIEVPLSNSTDYPSSRKEETDANLEELPKTESRDNGFEKSSQELGTIDSCDVLDKNSPASATLEEHVPPVVSDLPNNLHVTSNVAASDEQPIPKEPSSLSTDSTEIPAGDVVLVESSVGPTPEVQESLPLEKCSNENAEESNSSEVLSTLKSVGNVKDETSAAFDLQETAATCDDKKVINVEGGNSKSSEMDEKLIEEKNAVSEMDLSGNLINRSDSLEGNCGSHSEVSSQSNTAVAETSSQSPDTLETNPPKHQTTSSDTFEPPSFMTLVQSGNNNNQASEIETVHKETKAGWFPSLSNVSNESEGRKKNEEIIAKVTKQHHAPLKSLLNEVNSPTEKQVLVEHHQKDENDPKNNGADVAPTVSNSVLGPKKDVEDWNSPARYPIEMEKEKEKKKKKGKSYWVPFVCCSSVHRDL